MASVSVKAGRRWSVRQAKFRGVVVVVGAALCEVEPCWVLI